MRLDEGRIVKQNWITKYLNLYIKAPNILWLVGKYLKAGVMDEGRLMSAYFETVNDIMKSRVRESRMHGSVRGKYREVLVYSTDKEV